MLCENCGERIATTYCYIKINGKVVQKNLCVQCKNALILSDEISVNPEFKIKNQFCHNCGTTLKDFVASGFFGCENCYKEFEKVALSAIKSTRISDENLGKIPPRFAKKQEIEELEHLLDMAMNNGDLMQVNRLGAKLKLLKGER